MGKDSTHPWARNEERNANHNQACMVNHYSPLHGNSSTTSSAARRQGHGLRPHVLGLALPLVLLHHVVGLGPLVIDMIGANGEQNPPLSVHLLGLHRGAAAIALLLGSQGGRDGVLKACGP